jgi:hypothetical protein
MESVQQVPKKDEVEEEIFTHDCYPTPGRESIQKVPTVNVALTNNFNAAFINNYPPVPDQQVPTTVNNQINHYYPPPSAYQPHPFAMGSGYPVGSYASAAPLPQHPPTAAFAAGTQFGGGVFCGSPYPAAPLRPQIAHDSSKKRKRVKGKIADGTLQL